MAYGKAFVGEVLLGGITYHFELSKNGYSGAVNTTMLFGDPAIMPDFDQTDNPFEPHKKHKLRVMIRATVSLNLDTFEFINKTTWRGSLYTAYGTANEKLLYRGYLVPFEMEEDVKRYELSPILELTLTDGINFLKAKDYGIPPPPTVKISLKDLIAKALKQTGHGLPFEIYDNGYEEFMNTGATDCPLAQTFVDTFTYTDESDKPWNYYDVLIDILNSRNLSLKQQDGVWRIVAVHEARGATVAGRAYSVEGVYTGAVTLGAETETVGLNGTVKWTDFGVRRILEPLGQQRVQIAYRELNMIKNGTFLHYNGYAPYFWNLIGSWNDGYIDAVEDGGMKLNGAIWFTERTETDFTSLNLFGEWVNNVFIATPQGQATATESISYTEGTRPKPKNARYVESDVFEINPKSDFQFSAQVTGNEVNYTFVEIKAFIPGLENGTGTSAARYLDRQGRWLDNPYLWYVEFGSLENDTISLSVDSYYDQEVNYRLPLSYTNCRVTILQGVSSSETLPLGAWTIWKTVRLTQVPYEIVEVQREQWEIKNANEEFSFEESPIETTLFDSSYTGLKGRMFLNTGQTADGWLLPNSGGARSQLYEQTLRARMRLLSRFVRLYEGEVKTNALWLTPGEVVTMSEEAANGSLKALVLHVGNFDIKRGIGDVVLMELGTDEPAVVIEKVWQKADGTEVELLKFDTVPTNPDNTGGIDEIDIEYEEEDITQPTPLAILKIGSRKTDIVQIGKTDSLVDIVGKARILQGEVFLLAEGNTNTGTKWIDGEGNVTDYIIKSDNGFEFKSEDNPFVATLDFSQLSQNVLLSVPNLAANSVIATDATAWMRGATNILTAKDFIGSASGNFDIGIKRNNIEILTVKSTGVDINGTTKTTNLAVTGLTTNYLPKVGAAGLLGNSQIFDDGSNVRIGTKLQVNTSAGIMYFENSGSFSAQIRSSGSLVLSADAASGSAVTLNTFGLERLRVTGSGAVGVKTTAPTHDFHVNGTTRTTKLLVNQSADSGEAAQITGTTKTTNLAVTGLTTNYLPKVGAAGLLGNSQVFDNGTNVGVGTALPAFNLDINGSNAADRTIRVGTGSGDANTARLLFGTPNREWELKATPLTSGKYSAVINYNSSAFGGDFGIENNGLRLFTVTNLGNVGIDKTTPTYKLDVNGTGHFTGAVQFDTVPSSLVDATTSNHLVRYSQFIASTSIKYLPTAVRTVALTNITLSGTQTVSGVALVANDRVLVTGQTTASQNGVYVVAAGAWTRATDSDTDVELRGFIVNVSAGTFAGYKYINTNQTAITVGTTAVTYAEFSNLAEIDPLFTAWRDTSRSANTVFAAPNGSAGAGAFRSLTAADIPSLDFSKITSGFPTTIQAAGFTDYDLLWAIKYDTITKNTAFNKDFGTGNEDVTRGDFSYSKTHLDNNFVGIFNAQSVLGAKSFADITAETYKFLNGDRITSYEELAIGEPEAIDVTDFDFGNSTIVNFYSARDFNFNKQVAIDGSLFFKNKLYVNGSAGSFGSVQVLASDGSTNTVWRNLLAADVTDFSAVARAAISENITGIDYNNSTGVFSLTSGYAIPTTTQLGNFVTLDTGQSVTGPKAFLSQTVFGANITLAAGKIIFPLGEIDPAVASLNIGHSSGSSVAAKINLFDSKNTTATKFAKLGIQGVYGVNGQFLKSGVNGDTWANITTADITDWSAAWEAQLAAQFVNAPANLNTIPELYAQIFNNADSIGQINLAFGTKQDKLTGTGFVKANGTTISYDNTVYEVAFNKNTAFNKNFGTEANTVAQGNHVHTFASITSKPTTIAGYGLTTDFNTAWDARLGTKTTNNLTEGTTNKYFTDARARAAISENITGIDYNNTTGIFSLTNGYAIPTATQLSSYLTTVPNLQAVTNEGASSTIRLQQGSYNYALISDTSRLNFRNGQVVTDYALVSELSPNNPNYVWNSTDGSEISFIGGDGSMSLGSSLEIGRTLSFAFNGTTQQGYTRPLSERFNDRLYTSPSNYFISRGSQLFNWSEYGSHFYSDEFISLQGRSVYMGGGDYGNAEEVSILSDKFTLNELEIDPNGLGTTLSTSDIGKTATFEVVSDGNGGVKLQIKVSGVSPTVNQGILIRP